MKAIEFKKYGEAIVQVGVYYLTAMFLTLFISDGITGYIWGVSLILGIFFLYIGVQLVRIGKQREELEAKLRAKGKRRQIKLLKNSIITYEETSDSDE